MKIKHLNNVRDKQVEKSRREKVKHLANSRRNIFLEKGKTKLIRDEKLNPELYFGLSNVHFFRNYPFVELRENESESFI